MEDYAYLFLTEFVLVGYFIQTSAWYTYLFAHKNEEHPCMSDFEVDRDDRHKIKMFSCTSTLGLRKMLAKR